MGVTFNGQFILWCPWAGDGAVKESRTVPQNPKESLGIPRNPTEYGKTQRLVSSDDL